VTPELATDDPSARLFRRLLLALLVAALVPYGLYLGASSIWDANEAYYVETPREMIESGDYVNPSFNYEPRFNKPVLTYWVVAGLYHAFGVSVGVERAAIAAAAMFMVAAAFLLARAASVHPLAPVLAAIGLAAGPRFFMFSRRILVDMAVSAAMTLTLLFFVLAEQYPARRRLFLTLMYVCVGAGVLTKGPVAAVVPALAFLAYLVLHRELGRLREMMIPAGMVIALAIAAPWYWLLYLEHGWTYISEFFIGENLGRYTSTVGVQTRGPAFYLPVLLGDSLPWSLCLPAVVAAWVRDRRANAARRREAASPSGPPDAAPPYLRIRTLLLIWTAAIVVFFSLSQTKQDLYIFPVVAAVAALGGAWVARAVDAAGADERGWLTGVLLLLAITLVGLGGFVLFVFDAAQTVYRVDGARLAGQVAVAGGLAIAGLVWRGRRAVAVLAALAIFVAFNWLLVLRALPAFEQYKPVVPLSEILARAAGPDDVVVHYDVALPSMVFYLRRHIDILIDREALLRQMRSGRTVFAVMPANRYDELKPVFGVPTCELGRRATSDIKLRSVIARVPPPEVVLVTTRCAPS
jgi:4-amino-4-deoxy-L-arabinose transferase-like glycosyltransferase